MNAHAYAPNPSADELPALVKLLRGVSIGHGKVVFDGPNIAGRIFGNWEVGYSGIVYGSKSELDVRIKGLYNSEAYLANCIAREYRAIQKRSKQ